MCEFSPKLVAWMDGELPADEMAELDRHVGECHECRTRADKFRAVSRAFADYRSSGRELARPNLRRWLVPVGIAAGVALLIMTLPRPHPENKTIARTEQKIPLVTRAPANERAAVPAVATSFRKRRVRHAPKPARWMPAEPTVEVMIPADAIFPPGALPEGLNFVADLRLATNGYSASLGLRP